MLLLCSVNNLQALLHVEPQQPWSKMAEAHNFILGQRAFEWVGQPVIGQPTPPLGLQPVALGLTLTRRRGIEVKRNTKTLFLVSAPS